LSCVSAVRETCAVPTLRGLGALLLEIVACSPKGPMDVGSRADYRDEGATLYSSYEGQTPKIEMEKRSDRWFITVYQGRQPSSGHAIRVERAIGVGTAVRLRARFTVPAPGAATLTVITSPAHTISMTFGADAVYLYDQDDRQRAEFVRP
jgi:hypothetical protein